MDLPGSKRPLTVTEENVLEAIRVSVASRGFPPTVREIGAAVGVASPSHVHGILERLERDGRIERIGHSPRAIRVLDNQSND